MAHSMKFLQGLLKNADEMASKGREILQASQQTREKPDDYLKCLSTPYGLLEDNLKVIFNMGKKTDLLEVQ